MFKLVKKEIVNLMAKIQLPKIVPVARALRLTAS